MAIWKFNTSSAPTVARSLVETSKKLRLAHAKRFRAEEIRKYERVLAITKRRQEQIAPKLKKRGYAVLKEAPNEPKQ